METSIVSKFLKVYTFTLLMVVQLVICKVTYDKKAVVINGQRRILLFGSIHYPRSTPEMWEDLINKAKDANLDVIETYVFWNVHEPSPGNIENEYQPAREALGKAGEAYVQWAAHMAVGLNTGDPRVMCKEDDASDPIIPSMWLNQINTCNGFYCDEFSPNKPYKPTMWTEAWSGWFAEFVGTIPMRQVQDLAFAVARFIQKCLIREPKYSHLKELQRVIKLCEQALISSDPKVTSLGSSQEAHVFSSGKGSCVAFLSNYDSNSAARVVLNNKHFNLPPWSISILPNYSRVAFNTAKPMLNVHSNGHAVHVFVNGKLSGYSYGTRKDTKFTFIGSVDLQAGTNRIELLSIVVGLPNKVCLLADNVSVSAVKGELQMPMVNKMEVQQHLQKIAKMTKSWIFKGPVV
ncbi:Beta-galactosidase 5 [Capsicum annuum]